MEIKKYGIDELNKARKLQDDAVKLHMPSPPVLLWKAKVFDKDGILIEDIESKANSYTRNALNMLVYHLGMCSLTVVNNGAFGDGYINYKSTSGSTLYTPASSGTYRTPSGTPIIQIGTDNTAEDLNISNIVNPTGTSAQSTQTLSTFENNKLITLISRMFTCNVETSYCEAGIILPYYLTNLSGNLLMVRDVFTPITVPINGSIVFSYQTEVLYPAA